MNNVLEHARFAAALGLSALVGSATLASGQDPAASVATTAQHLAYQTDNAIRAIDPSTRDSGSVSSSGQPQSEVDLPPLPGAEPAPRGPASRTIAQPVVQPAIDHSDPFVVKSILPIEGTIRYGEWYWDESQAPSKGKLVMTVDLDARVISVFRDGHEIGTAVALLGTQKHPTPLGSFPILTKEKDNVSEKYDNAPMPWTLRLTWDGIAIHGSPVMNGYASHGCIGVPDPFAEKLFAIARRGDRVIITRGQMIGLGDKITS